MATINFDSLRTCQRTLREQGFDQTLSYGRHGHGGTIWANSQGEIASITLNPATGCFALYCPLHRLCSTVKAKLCLSGIPGLYQVEER